MANEILFDSTSFSPLARGSITREVAARLLSHLTAGDLPPGSRLPSERQLATSLQVGRSAVRESLAALEVLGIVDSRPGSGTYLRNHSSDLLPTVINWGLALGQPRTLDLVETRAELEVITARFAAQRSTAEDIARLTARTNDMTAAKNDLDKFIDADVAFHLEIADMTGNTVLADILHSVRALLQVWVERAVRAEGNTKSTLTEHRFILRAIKSGDVDAAEAAMRAHMLSAGNRLKLSIEKET